MTFFRADRNCDGVEQKRGNIRRREVVVDSDEF
jgi:hypothetical protein